MARWGAGGDARAGRAGGRRPPGLAATLLCLAWCLVLTACGAQATATHLPAGVAAAQGLDATPGATEMPDPEAARNAALGCAPAAPKPQPEVLWSGIRPGATPPKEVALTFDDGPTPYTSPPIYAVLEQWHAPATFFVEGQYAKLWPNLVAREWRDGFAVAVHTWDHPMMSRETPDQVHHQFADTLDAIHAAIGKDACIWLWRPPYGDYNAAVVQAAASFGLTTITWDNSSDDWDRPGVAQIVHNVLAQAHPGAVVLMHDGPALREETAAALPFILQGLLDRGLTPVTLPRLLADAGWPGVSVAPSPLPRLTPQSLPPMPTPVPTQAPSPTATPKAGGPSATATPNSTATAGA